MNTQSYEKLNASVKMKGILYDNINEKLEEEIERMTNKQHKTKRDEAYLLQLNKTYDIAENLYRHIKICGEDDYQMPEDVAEYNDLTPAEQTLIEEAYKEVVE